MDTKYAEILNRILKYCCDKLKVCSKRIILIMRIYALKDKEIESNTIRILLFTVKPEIKNIDLM